MLFPALSIISLCSECSWTGVCQDCHPPRNTCASNRQAISPPTAAIQPAPPAPSIPWSDYMASALAAIRQQQADRDRKFAEQDKWSIDKKEAMALELAGRKDGHAFKDLRSSANGGLHARQEKETKVTLSNRATKKLERKFGLTFRGSRTAKKAGRARSGKGVLVQEEKKFAGAALRWEIDEALEMLACGEV